MSSDVNTVQLTAGEVEKLCNDGLKIIDEIIEAHKKDNNISTAREYTVSTLRSARLEYESLLIAARSFRQSVFHMRAGLVSMPQLLPGIWEKLSKDDDELYDQAK